MTKRRGRPAGVALVVLALVASMTAVAAAQELAHSQFIPVVASADGVGGTRWVSDVTVHNATDHELVVGYQFLPANRANAFNPSFPARFTLQPRETRVFEDVVGGLLDIVGDGSGSLLFTVDPSLIAGNPEGAKILASTRVYNVGSPGGTYGQTVPALSRTINAAASPSYITGARNDSRFRSNLGVVCMALLDEITVEYVVRDAAGSSVAEGAVDVEPSSMSQWSFASLGVPLIEGPLTVELRLAAADVWPDPCAGPLTPNMFMAYVSKVDGNPEGTGDAEFIYAAPTEPYSCP